MEKAFNREIVLEDAKLFEMVEEKGKLVEEGRAHAKRAEELAKEHEKCVTHMNMVAGKLDRHKRKIIARVERAAKDLIGEYEVPVTTEIKDGKLVLIVADSLAEFKDQFSKINKFQQAPPVAKRK